MNKDLMRQAQQFQARMAKMQEELATETVEASVGGGVITVVVTGQQVVQSISIQPEAVDPNDVEMLQDLVLTAVNEGLEKSREHAAKKLSVLTGGMKIPGMM